MTTNRQRLLRAAHRLMGSRADAEDAVQDTYVRALAAFPNSPGPQPAWLHTVLRNIAIDRLRRRQLEAAHANSGLRSEEWPDTLNEVRSDCEAAFRHLLSRVNFTEAAAILLRDVFEFDYDEIARLVGKSEVAARQFLRRARTRASRADRLTDVEESHVRVLWRAIESRDPARLSHMLQTTIAWAQPAALTAGRRDARSSTMLVQRNGRYALALVLDGIVLCIVPVGTQTTVRDSA